MERETTVWDVAEAAYSGVSLYCVDREESSEERWVAFVRDVVVYDADRCSPEQRGKGRTAQDALNSLAALLSGRKAVVERGRRTREELVMPERVLVEKRKTAARKTPSILVFHLVSIVACFLRSTLGSRGSEGRRSSSSGCPSQSSPSSAGCFTRTLFSRPKTEFLETREARSCRSREPR